MSRMKRLGLILVVVVIAMGGWLAWTYYQTDHAVREIASHLPSEEELDRMTPEEIAGSLQLQLSLAMGCGSTAELQGSEMARMMKGAEIAALSDRCDLIKARLGSLEGP